MLLILECDKIYFITWKGVTMYLNYWKLNKHPFNNVPDPEMYFDMHHSVDEAVGEILFAIEEGDDCLAVVIGRVGVGKTTCLRMVLNTLEQSKYKIAFVTNPDMTFPQLLREIIGQIEEKPCEERSKDKLLELFNKILFQTNDENKRVVIFIDEGNVIKPHNLDSLRLLTNMQDDHQNLFTIVLAGQPELAKRLENPKRENLFQRIGVYCRIEGIDSIETMRDYIEHRLERAGLCKGHVFFDEAYRSLWKFSNNGVPRLINKICKLALKAGETNKLTLIDKNIVDAVGKSFERTYKRLRKTLKHKLPNDKTNSVNSSNSTPAPEFKILNAAERERIASKIASERINHMTRVADPFEAWTQAKNEILNEMDMLQQAVTSQRAVG
ncbi:ExeA family protein [Verrucomicrobiota bacterium]